jgi:RNA polymerase sigma-70 factor, ECF subfamily
MSSAAPNRFYEPDRDAQDAVLLSRLNQADAGAFRAIFDAYAERLVLYAASLLARDVPAAEDVVNELFTYLWTHKHTLTVQESLRTYLYRATRNRCLDVLRHQRVHLAAQQQLTIFLRTEAADATGHSSVRELAKAIECAVSDLPARAREIWRLNRDEQLSYSEIARVLGISVKTVETHMGRALRALRSRLAAWR